MPIKEDREYRTMRVIEADSEEEFKAAGYAATFERYLLFEDGEIKFYEVIMPDAFNAADMNDVIMQFDHSGRVYARSKNNTLKLLIDNYGLNIEADLSTTNSARELWREIKAGLIDKMSFAFTVEEDHFEKLGNDYLRVIDKIKKVYDVSAVSIPANSTTFIKARSLFNGAIEEERKEFAARAEKKRRKEKLQLKIKMIGA